jgi:uncharacterized protein YdeI (BOF family)
VPAGDYRLTVSDRYGPGTYKLGVGLQPAPQVFAVSLPATVSDGDPAAGAGNLETTSSEDDYTFTTTNTGPLGIEVSDCDSGLSNSVHYVVTTAATAAVLGQGDVDCGSSSGAQLQDVPPGNYQVAITNNSRKGAYKLRIAAPQPQGFSTTLPIAVTSADSPWSGAGRIEFPTSEDRYEFTTTTSGNIQIDISNCSLAQGWVRYVLKNTATGAILRDSWSCWSQTVDNVPAGYYQLTISDRYGPGTYRLAVGLT